MREYRPHLTDEEEHQEELENSIDDCETYLILAIQSIQEYREFADLKEDLQTMLNITKDKKKEIKI